MTPALVRPRLLACVALVFVASVLARAQALPRATAPTVHVTVVRPAQSTPQHAMLVVRVEGRGMVLGSYEGKVSFDPKAFAVDSAIVGRDGSRFVNAGDTKSGVIRFAGFTTTGFTSPDAVTLIGRALKPLEQSHVAASVAVAGDLDGRKVPKAGLIGATGVTVAR
jgi:hypothetical protein